ncbi:stealth family protein [Balneolales bacterium ANBcel1]|nr:stealth family protein [Balneolales bacterium ANBcel1]
MKTPSPNIDAVITWVDGNDEQHRRSMQEVIARTGALQTHEVRTSRDPTRFLDNGELFYCIRSIRKFAPWIRTIFLVTADQTPPFLTHEERQRLGVTMVGHREIFAPYEHHLPTFNSRSIETALWRIPGLAPRFLYFNDDFVLTAPVSPGDFFTDDGVVIHGKWNAMTRYGPIRLKLNGIATRLSKRLLGITRSMNLLLQIRSARLAGHTGRYFRTTHIPHAVRTETLRAWFDTRPDVLEENIAYQFRSEKQFSGIFLAHHLEIAAGKAELRDTGGYVMINGENDFGFILRRKLSRIAAGRTRFACLHALERFSASRLDAIRRTFDRLVSRESTGSGESGLPLK